MSATPPPPAAPAPPSPVVYGSRRKRWLSAFIVLHWLLVAPWVVPSLTSWRPLTGFYTFLTGHWQEWAMFALVVPQTHDLRAVVRFDGGGQQTYRLPRVAHMGFFEAWGGARYREYRDRLLEGRPQFVARPGLAQDDFARYVARRLAAPGRMPETVVLEVCITPIPPPDPGAPWADQVARLRYPASMACRPLRVTPVGGAGGPVPDAPP